MSDLFAGLTGAADDDPTVELDDRGRLSMGKLAGDHRLFVVNAEDGQILLTPAIAVSARDPLADALTDAVNNEPRATVALDKRGRLSLRTVTGGHRRYLATAQSDGRILLTPLTIIAAGHPLFEQLSAARARGVLASRPPRAART